MKITYNLVLMKLGELYGFSRIEVKIKLKERCIVIQGMN